MTKDEVIDLRRRVLSGAPVSDEELRNALAALCRSMPVETSSEKAAAPKIDAMALLRNKLGGKAVPQ